MIRPEFRQILLDQRGAAVILWCIFLMSIVLYIVIAHNVLANPKYARGLWFAESARPFLWGLTAIDLGYYAYWKKRYLAPRSVSDAAPRTKMFRALDVYDGLHEKEAALVVSAYITRTVVLFAILEAVAVNGLLLAIVGRYFTDLYLLSGLSWLLLAFEFPSAGRLERYLKEVESGA